MSNFPRLVLAVPAFGLLGLLSACETGPRSSDLNTNFDLEASRTSIYVGENVTFNAEAENTYGRDADIKWTTSGGDMTEVDGDRVRRITFDKAGQYKVSADLLYDGDRVATDMVTINVMPIR